MFHEGHQSNRSDQNNRAQIKGRKRKKPFGLVRNVEPRSRHNRVEVHVVKSAAGENDTEKIAARNADQDRDQTEDSFCAVHADHDRDESEQGDQSIHEIRAGESAVFEFAERVAHADSGQAQTDDDDDGSRHKRRKKLADAVRSEKIGNQGKKQIDQTGRNDSALGFRDIRGVARHHRAERADECERGTQKDRNFPFCAEVKQQSSHARGKQSRRR